MHNEAKKEIRSEIEKGTQSVVCLFNWCMSLSFYTVCIQLVLVAIGCSSVTRLSWWNGGSYDVVCRDKQKRVIIITMMDGDKFLSENFASLSLGWGLAVEWRLVRNPSACPPTQAPRAHQRWNKASCAGRKRNSFQIGSKYIQREKLKSG